MRDKPIFCKEKLKRSYFNTSNVCMFALKICMFEGIKSKIKMFKTNFRHLLINRHKRVIQQQQQQQLKIDSSIEPSNVCNIPYHTFEVCKRSVSLW